MRIGSEEKGDCLVEVEPGRDGLTVETKNKDLLEEGIRTVVGEAVSTLGVDASVRTVETGALDYVIVARVEAAVRAAAPDRATPIVPSVDRDASERDRPRRSRLYAPGNRPRLLAGIEVHGADCVLLDLEDAVPLAEKPAARILVKHLLATVRFPDEVWVRINPLDAGGRDDVEEILLGRPHGICLPKAESAADVRALSELLRRVESNRGVDEGGTWILPILETAAGVLHAEEIASADPRVVALAFGAEDYTRDVGARRRWDALLYARSRIVAAAASAGIQASDTVFADLDDAAGLEEECVRARDLGFDGKGAINPRQLPAIHRAFSPTEDEIEYARRVVAAAEEAEANGAGAVALDGRMVDRPVLERARRTIKYAGRLVGRGEER